MKKILSIAIVLIGVSAYAQKKLPTDPYPVRTTNVKEVLRGARSMGHDVRIEDRKAPVARQAAPAVTTAASTNEPYIGYLNPKGTMFLGMDEAGSGTFFKNPAVIGGWSDSIECWTWINQQKDYKSIKYLTYFSYEYAQYEDGEYYWIDKDGNFCDAIVAAAGLPWNMDAEPDVTQPWFWHKATPLQTVRLNDDTEKNFVLLSSSSNPTVEDCTLAYGGLPCANTADGLWPLTNAVSTTTAGVSASLIAYTAADKYVHYLFGSSKLTVDSNEVGGVMGYTRVKPLSLTTTYDKPQTPLYIKNVTMALSSDKYSAFKPKDLHFESLHISIQTMDGKELASSTATSDALSKMGGVLQKGRLLTFPLLQKKTEYGELLSEGLLIDEPFQIVLTGFQESDNFGLFAAKCIIHPTKTEMLYEGGVTKQIDWEPYIMLNGIYPTLEDYFGTRGASIGQVGDTIPVKMMQTGEGKYHYIAAYKQGGSEATEFYLYSTFLPYDSLTRTWNMDVEAPDYITVYADYERNIGTESDPCSLWEYFRMFSLQFYATETPVIGDYIKIGKAGKYMYYRIDAITGQMGVDEVLDGAGRAEKLLQNGQILIRKNNKTYNVLGIQQ